MMLFRFGIYRRQKKNGVPAAPRSSANFRLSKPVARRLISSTATRAIEPHGTLEVRARIPRIHATLNAPLHALGAPFFLLCALLRETRLVVGDSLRCILKSAVIGVPREILRDALGGLAQRRPGLRPRIGAARGLRMDRARKKNRGAKGDQQVDVSHRSLSFIDFQ